MKIIAALVAGCLFLAGFAGCVEGGDENEGANADISVLARLAGGEWSNGTVAGNMVETITADNRETPESRTKTVPSFEFKAEGAADAAWDFGDGETGTGANASHTYAAPGKYLVIATSGNKSANITVAVNIESSGEDSVTAIPGQDPGGLFQKGTNYQEYIITIGAGAKLTIDLTGAGMVAELSDIDMVLYDPSGKEIASSTGGTCDEQITVKKAKAGGNYKLMIGETPGGLYTSIGPINYSFKIVESFQ